MRQVFPFAAIVGQDLLKTALLVSAVNPSIGGVLVRGDKGTAKSTAARALAAVLPSLQRIEGCAFNCAPAHPLPACDTCSSPDKRTSESPVPFVNLPIGATEDRVIGSLDFEKALKSGKRAFQPGLLASAHRGVLYIDEVNLLPDHLVDSLLDAAASGVNTVEREGIGFSHPASFTLIGTMNLEEGDLRPQLLDRFGLMVEVAAPTDPMERAEVVRRRMHFEDNQTEFCAHWQGEQERIRSLIVAAQELYPKVLLSEELLIFISALCSQMQVKSLRADVVINKTARALCALNGRTEVNEDDIQTAALLALPHRCRTKPGERSSMDKDQLEQMMQQLSNEQNETDQADGDKDESGNGTDEQPEIFPIAQPPAVRRVSVNNINVAASSGRRSTGSTTERGAFVRAVKQPEFQPGSSVAVEATVRHSILRNGGTLNVESEDLHAKQRVSKTGNMILFVVDASGSMSAMARMSAVKGAVMALLDDAYRCRDSVGVISFRGEQAELLLPPTRSTDLARDRLETLGTGGTTPLAHAIELAHQTLVRGGSNQAPLLVVLTDGKANVPTTPGTDPWINALDACDRVKQAGIPALVIDTESGFVLLGQAQSLAEAIGGEYVRLEELSSESLKLTIKSRLKLRSH